MLLANRQVAQEISATWPEISLLRRHPPPKVHALSHSVDALNCLVKPLTLHLFHLWCCRNLGLKPSWSCWRLWTSTFGWQTNNTEHSYTSFAWSRDAHICTRPNMRWSIFSPEAHSNPLWQVRHFSEARPVASRISATNPTKRCKSLWIPWRKRMIHFSTGLEYKNWWSWGGRKIHLCQACSAHDHSMHGRSFVLRHWMRRGERLEAFWPCFSALT